MQGIIPAEGSRQDSGESIGCFVRIGVFAKTYRTDFADNLIKAIRWLESRDCRVLVDQHVVATFGLQEALAFAPEGIPEQADVIIVFGGDGTLLATARLIKQNRAPILGVNLGSLGFMTEVTLEELDSSLEKLLAGDYRISRRSLLQIVLKRKNGEVLSFEALNDAVINKGALARIINMDTFSGGDFITTFQADGLIIATPTGSTAYSLSAGGPIVYPTADLIVLTPICPHTLTNRPLIIPAESRVRVILESGDDVMLTVDGQVGTEMDEGDVLECTRSGNFVELIQPVDKSFFDILREKLKWGERYHRVPE